MKKIKAYDNKEVFVFGRKETVNILTKGTPKEKAVLFNNLGKLLHWWDDSKKWFKDNFKNKKELQEFKEIAEQEIKKLLIEAGYKTNDKKEKEQYIHFTVCGINMHQIPLYDEWNTDITLYLFNSDGSIKPFNGMLKSFYKSKRINPKEQENETLEEYNKLTEEQKEAVKELLKNECEELKDITNIEAKGDGVFLDFGYKEYLIMTEEQAQERAEEYIKSSLWAFNPSFLQANCKGKIHEDVFKAISEQCEGGNDALLSLVGDIDGLIENAILSDGRGHFLSSYDGNETELKNEFVYIRED